MSSQIQDPQNAKTFSSTTHGSTQMMFTKIQRSKKHLSGRRGGPRPAAAEAAAGAAAELQQQHRCLSMPEEKIHGVVDLEIWLDIGLKFILEDNTSHRIGF